VVQPHAGEQQADVADAVGDEHADRGLDRAGAVVEEGDEQDGGHADELPADEQQLDAAGEDHQLHAGAEEQHEQEEADEPGLAVEVVDREARRSRAGGWR
jgi:hypothetical protein